MHVFRRVDRFHYFFYTQNWSACEQEVSNRPGCTAADLRLIIKVNINALDMVYGFVINRGLQQKLNTPVCHECPAGSLLLGVV